MNSVDVMIAITKLEELYASARRSWREEELRKDPNPYRMAYFDGCSQAYANAIAVLKGLKEVAKES